MHCKKYSIKILDCLRGLYYAVKLEWFDFKKFDLTEYEHYEKIENGDLNWIIPNKFIAFSSPYDKNKDDSGVFNMLDRILCLLQRTMCQYSKNSEFLLSFVLITRPTKLMISSKTELVIMSCTLLMGLPLLDKF